MRILVFTANYPTGFGESYLNYELPELLKYFDKVSIVSLEKKQQVQKGFYHLQNDIPVSYFSTYKPECRFSFKDKMFVIRNLFSEFLHCSNKLFFIRKIRTLYASLKKAVILSSQIQKEVAENDLLYSFWMNEWALALAVLKKKGFIKGFVFRVNGYDIYNERHDGNYLPFRYFIYSQCNQIFAVSKSASFYLKTLGYFPDKISFSYFGTPDFGFSRVSERNELVIFSCSAVIEIKRVDKIAKVMCALDIPVKWIHHGEGPEMNAVCQIIKNGPENVQFISSKNNEDIEDLKKSERDLAADIFINLSSTEGLPVTAIEAMSFGCTLVLNRAGSCEELINPITGVLVEIDEEPIEIAKKIKALYSSGQTSSNRVAIRNHWNENFSATENYKKFAQDLKQTVV